MSFSINNKTNTIKEFIENQDEHKIPLFRVKEFNPKIWYKVMPIFIDEGQGYEYKFSIGDELICKHIVDSSNNPVSTEYYNQ